MNALKLADDIELTTESYFDTDGSLLGIDIVISQYETRRVSVGIKDAAGVGYALALLAANTLKRPDVQAAYRRAAELDRKLQKEAQAV